MNINIAFFGPLKEVIGDNQITLEGITNTEELSNSLMEKYHDFKLQKFRISLNNELITETTPINDGDRIVIFSAISGG